VVRDDGLRAEAADGVAAEAARHGFREVGRVDSALPGPKGNREIFLRLLPEGADPMFS
jgi:predicted rRNA methylase YqxC with S4 and FtsJ domains